jgi:lipoprotein-anchoring transpeptidase ErfK/SrfK
VAKPTTDGAANQGADLHADRPGYPRSVPARSTSTPTRRASALLAQVIGVVLAFTLGVALLGSCAGERPTLGAKAPSRPETTTTTAPTTTVPVGDDLVLTPADLQGWIATPVGEPEVYAEPSTDAERLDIGATTEAGAPTTFAIVGEGDEVAPQAQPGWYRVALPTRPNGSTAWTPDTAVSVTKTPLRIFVDLEGRSLRVEEDGQEVFATEVAIGTEENPTPVNGTFVTELIDNIDPDGAYGPYAFGLAMHSDTLTEFNGGPGQVGIHGTNRPELIGERVSSGCVRLTNEDVEALVDLQLPLGVPVFIT